MFSECARPRSRKPVTSCRNNLIAVCWAHTNQGIDMCTLSLCSGDRQSLQSYNAFFPHNCQTSQYFARLHRNATVASHSHLLFLGLMFNFFRWICDDYHLELDIQSSLNIFSHFIIYLAHGAQTRVLFSKHILHKE